MWGLLWYSKGSYSKRIQGLRDGISALKEDLDRSAAALTEQMAEVQAAKAELANII